jgi:hypothetical protein
MLIVRPGWQYRIYGLVHGKLVGRGETHRSVGLACLFAIE